MAFLAGSGSESQALTIILRRRGGSLVEYILSTSPVLELSDDGEAVSAGVWPDCCKSSPVPEMYIEMTGIEQSLSDAGFSVLVEAAGIEPASLASPTGVSTRIVSH